MDITDDEIPFELPNNWKFARFSTIITLQSGQDLNSSDYNSENIGIPYITGASNYGDEGTIIINRWTDFPKAIALHGDIILSCKGTVGKIAILDEPRVHIARQIMGIRTYSMNVRYIRYFIERMVDGIKEASKGLIPGIERNDVLKLCCPIPPLSEQDRIVNVIETAISELDNIDVLQQQYKSDRETLKGKIIDAGISGKLTEQLSEDGTADELYAQIQEEKANLIKDGKTKKEKPLPEISDDEIPFEIPKNWKWVRVADIAFLSSGKPYEETEEGVLYIKVYDMNLPENETQIVTSTHFVNANNDGIIPVNSIIFPKRGGAIATNKKRMVFQNPVFVDLNTMGMTVMLPDIFMFVKYWFDTLKLDEIQNGTTIPQVNNKDIYPLILPLPPIEEQKRIVDKIDELLDAIACK